MKNLEYPLGVASARFSRRVSMLILAVFATHGSSPVMRFYSRPIFRYFTKAEIMGIVIMLMSTADDYWRSWC